MNEDQAAATDGDAAESWSYIDELLSGNHTHGTCPYCENPLTPAGDCLNLCLMPTGMSRKFQQGLQSVISQNRAKERWILNLAGCVCTLPALRGYEYKHEPWQHEHRCPVRLAAEQSAAATTAN